MALRLANAICRRVATLVLSATIVAMNQTTVQADGQTEYSPQAPALPPMVKAALAEALKREEYEKHRDRRYLRPVSLPLPVCLFEHGLCGAVSRAGSIAVAPRYDFIDDFSEGRAAVRLAGLYGYVDTSGKVVVEPQYRIAGRYRLGVAEVDIEGKSALIDLDGRQVLAPRFARAVPFTREVFWVNDGTRDYRGAIGGEEFHESDFRSGSTKSVFVRGKWGLVDKNGLTIRAPEFQDIARFDPDNGDIMWAQAATGWGLIRPDGSWLLDPTFEYKRDLRDGFAVVWRDKKLGYIDRSGQLVIPPKFDIISGWADFIEGMPAPAKLGGLVGLIDRSGNWVIEPAYESISPAIRLRSAFDAGPEIQGFRATRGDKSALLDATGKVIIDFIIEQEIVPPAKQTGRGFTVSLSLHILPTICPDGRVMGIVDKKVRYFNSDGTPIELASGQIERLSCNAPHVVKVGGKFGYVDAALRPITEPKFEAAAPFRDGVATVRLSGKNGLIRTDGTWALDAAFDGVQALPDNLALVQAGNDASLVDVATAALVTPTQFDEACSLGRGIVGVMVDGKLGAIDPKGHWLFEPRYDRWESGFHHGFVPVRSGGKWGFVDGAGNAIAATFDEVRPFERGMAWARNGGAWCPIDRRGIPVPGVQCQSVDPNPSQRPQPEQMSCRIPH